MFTVGVKRPSLSQPQPAFNPGVKTRAVGNYPFADLRKRTVGRAYNTDQETFLTTSGPGQVGVLSGRQDIGKGAKRTSTFSSYDFRQYAQQTVFPLLPSGPKNVRQLADAMDKGYQLGRVDLYHGVRAKNPWRSTAGSKQMRIAAEHWQALDTFELALRSVMHFFSLRNHQKSDLSTLPRVETGFEKSPNAQMTLEDEQQELVMRRNIDKIKSLQKRLIPYGAVFLATGQTTYEKLGQTGGVQNMMPAEHEPTNAQQAVHAPSGLLDPNVAPGTVQQTPMVSAPAPSNTTPPETPVGQRLGSVPVPPASEFRLPSDAPAVIPSLPQSMQATPPTFPPISQLANYLYDTVKYEFTKSGRDDVWLAYWNNFKDQFRAYAREKLAWLRLDPSGQPPLEITPKNVSIVYRALIRIQKSVDADQLVLYNMFMIGFVHMLTVLGYENPAYQAYAQRAMEVLAEHPDMSIAGLNESEVVETSEESSEGVERPAPADPVMSTPPPPPPPPPPSTSSPAIPTAPPTPPMMSPIPVRTTPATPRTPAIGDLLEQIKKGKTLTPVAERTRGARAAKAAPLTPEEELQKALRERLAQRRRVVVGEEQQVAATRSRGR
jgi:hypothetical protein